MFNQFKSALESVAQQPIRILDATSESQDPENESLDVQGLRSAALTSGQLAESAMSSLRKSIASQRGNSQQDSAKSLSSTPATRKSTLEERLRRAAQRPASSDTPSHTRGRSDTATKEASSRVTSASPHTRGRTDSSKSQPDKLPSRTASPAAASVHKPSSGSQPPSRSASPSPASKPPSRVSSPAPASRSASTTRNATVSSTNKIPSRSGSPIPARTRRASELVTNRSRAPSPSPLTKHQSSTANNSTLPSSLPAAASSADSPKAELTHTSSEEPSPIAADEQDKKMLDTNMVEPTEMPSTQSGNVTPTDSKGSQSQSLNQQPGLEGTTNAAHSEATTGFGNSTISLTAESPDVAEQGEPTSSQGTGANVYPVPEESESKVEHVIQNLSPMPVAQHEVDLSTSDSKTSPAFDTLVSEPPKQISNDRAVDHSAEVEGLRARLKEVEQRFSDVSISFKRLQAEKLTADAVLKENSPLESFGDSNALRDYFVDLRTKDEVFQDEIKRLKVKLDLQDEQLRELRETQKIEIQALSGDLRKTKTLLHETDALFEAAQRATTKIEETADKRKGDISRLEKELEKVKNTAKEEEEKRVKAITLLKTVRQKLVKSEKEKEDMMREMATAKEREKGDKDREQAEKVSLVRELEISQSTHTQEVTGLRARLEKDLATTRERYEQELGGLKGQYELDLAATKTFYDKELSSKSSHIANLEKSVNGLNRDKSAFFEQLQRRQAELESAQAHVDTMQHQNAELEFQLREANDRLGLVKEEYAELQRETETKSREPTITEEEIVKMVSATEAKYEARLVEMKRNISELEKERHDSEVDWSRKLKEKVRELEDLKSMLGSATRMRESEENATANLKTELESAQQANEELQQEMAKLTLLKERIEELERSSKEQEDDTQVKIRILEKLIDEHKARESQLKQGNKTLRDELRKVQSSAALLERQRNPGVGYWGVRTPGGGGSGPGDGANGSPTDSRVSSDNTPSRSSSPTPSTASTKGDEEVNLEYVRNVVLQFLEHKERRPQLVKVLSIILHFTPQETRRLIAKV